MSESNLLNEYTGPVEENTKVTQSETEKRLFHRNEIRNSINEPNKNGDHLFDGDAVLDDDNVSEQELEARYEAAISLLNRCHNAIDKLLSGSVTESDRIASADISSEAKNISEKFEYPDLIDIDYENEENFLDPVITSNPDEPETLDTLIMGYARHIEAERAQKIAGIEVKVSLSEKSILLDKIKEKIIED